MKSNFCKYFSWIVTSIILLETLAIASSSDQKVIFQSRSFPHNLKEDGFWAAIHAGKDGKVYIGLNTEGGGSAQFYIYDPVTDKIRHRADLSEFLGEKGKAIQTHAKIHTKFCEDEQGRIYFATGNMGAGPNEVDPRTWKGGRWCRYDPAKDNLDDLGQILPGTGVYGLTIDKKRMRLYGTAHNGHFVIFDIDKGVTIDKGRMHYNARSVTRTIVIDDNGNVYGTYLLDRVFKYDIKTERLLDLSIQMPSNKEIFPRTHSIYKRYMRAGIWHSGHQRIYGVEGGTSILFSYDPFDGREGRMQKMAQLIPQNLSEMLIKSHYATLTFTKGLDDKIYYLPIGPLESNQENSSIPFDRWAGQAQLIVFDLISMTKTCFGPAFTEDGMRVIDMLTGAPSGGATIAPDGTIYMVVFVEENNPEKVGYIFGRIPTRLRLLIYHPPNN